MDYPVFSKVVLFTVATLSVATANASCSTRDVSGASTPIERSVLKAFGEGWLMNATVCQVGPYEVAVPQRSSGRDDRRILLLLHGKPVLQRMKGDTLLFDPNPAHAKLSYPIVSVWNGRPGKDVGHFWYRTIPGKNGRHVFVYDSDFDGQPDLRTIWKGKRVVKAFAWYQHQWRELRKGCIMISGRCAPAQMVDGEWRLKR